MTCARANRAAALRPMNRNEFSSYATGIWRIEWLAGVKVPLRAGFDSRFELFVASGRRPDYDRHATGSCDACGVRAKAFDQLQRFDEALATWDRRSN